MTPLERIAATAGLAVQPVADVSAADLAAAFTAAFADYPVPVALTAAQHDARFRSESGDPYASHLFSRDGEPVAMLLIARRGWVARVAAMGIAPRWRGTGLGAAIVGGAIDAARSRGDAALVLEAIESNVRAVKLYRRAGFAVVRPLSGFAIDARGTPGVAAAREIDPAVGAARAAALGPADPPWQLQAASLGAMVRPTRCFTDATGAIVAMVEAHHEPVRLRALACAPDLPASAAAAFTDALRATHPGRPWAAPPIFTEAHRTGFFAPGGWETTAMRQLEMRHPLASAPRGAASDDTT